MKRKEKARQSWGLLDAVSVAPDNDERKRILREDWAVLWGDDNPPPGLRRRRDDWLLEMRGQAMRERLERGEVLAGFWNWPGIGDLEIETVAEGECPYGCPKCAS